MKPKICIVDDEPEISSMCEEYLSEFYDVRSFSSADQAFKEFEVNYQPQVFLSDLKMPGMSGLDLAHKLNERNAHIPFLIMSGYADKNAALIAIEEHVAGFIEKPFAPKKLRELIDRSLHDNTPEKKWPELVAKYKALTQTLLDLTQQYQNRFVVAENRLYEMNIDLSTTPTGVKMFLQSIKAQSQLEGAIEVLVREIHTFDQQTIREDL